MELYGFKGHQTLKLSNKLAALERVMTLSRSLFFCFKKGSISYISDGYSSSITDRFIAEDTNIAAKFTPGFSVLFDKEFSVLDLLLQYKVTARIPPFLRSKRQLPPSKGEVEKRTARTRIHIEHVIGWLKEFRLLDHSLTLNLVDLVYEIWIILCAIANMVPSLVKNKVMPQFKII